MTGLRLPAKRLVGVTAKSASKSNRVEPALPDSAHSIDSSLREQVLEHLFTGELLRCLWTRGRKDIEVLRAEVDRGGYDLVLACNGILRHIQLKASYLGAKTSRVKVHIGLAAKPSGCVIWIRFDPDTLELGPFHWFGGRPGEPLPSLGDTVARHTKGDAKGIKSYRANIRVVNGGRFSKLTSITEVAERLFFA